MNGQQQILRQVEIIHTSLAGLALICIMLLTGLLLPVYGFHTLDSPLAALIVIAVVLVGVITLYILNYRAHKIVQDQARLTDVLINSLGQGFLSFDDKGVCGPVFSQACRNLLMTDRITGRSVIEVLRIPPAAQQEFKEWLEILFMPGHAFSFEDAVRFLPDNMPHEDGRNVALAYRPVYNKEQRLARIVLIATDRTEEVEAQKRADSERQFAAMICAIFAERQSFVITMAEMKEAIGQMAAADPAILDGDFLRTIHTLKGSALHFRMEKLSEAFHNLEEGVRDARERPPPAMKEAIHQGRAEVQLEFGRIQKALRGVLGEDDDYAQGLVEIDEESIYRFGELLQQRKVAPEIYNAYLNSILSVPLFSLLKTLDRQMATLADKMDKKVKPIQFRGASIRVPARPLQHLMLTLTHVVHNIVDHGIETPITRMAKGKDPQGQVVIDVSRHREGDNDSWIEIIIADDGAGIDPNRVRAKLGTADANGAWRFDDDAAVIQQLLTHDISTRDDINMISGRGVGMSAVYQEVLRLGGRCSLRSEVHKGTQLVIQLPERLEVAAH